MTERAVTRPVLRLSALFAALLAGCSDRELPAESASAGMTGGESESTGSTTSDAPGTTGTDTGTGTSTSTSTSTTTTTTTSNTVTSNTTEEPPPECVYADHLISLTPEEYAHWVEHGAPPPADTTGGETGGSSSGTTGEGSGGTTGEGTGGTTGGGGWSWELCVKICEHEAGAASWDVTQCEQTGVDPDGDVQIYCQEIIEHCDGRTHACVRTRGAAVGEDPVGAWFARATHDEAASVYAFIALGRELADHGAPAELLARIRVAAGDEIRHARATAALARRAGGVIRRPRRGRHAARALVEIARENAVEGCVRETWAALSAAHQARHAEDPAIRAAMAEIAGDEARHAELAWALDAWLASRLSPEERADVARARQAAVRQLRRHLEGQRDDAALCGRAGVPTRAAARRLAAGLERALWT